ncbi:MAG: 3-dehydroquinate synthase [Acidobacteriales bacterium]|nr:3-dehydroquinate synthase [Terriglobales bacterium]
MKKITVKLKSAPYDVLVGSGLLRSAGKRISRVLKKPSLCVIVTSPRIRKFWGDALEKSLESARLRFQVAEMDDGEAQKIFASVEMLMREFAAMGADRSSVVIALGGGVVGDVAGFAASIFMRGIPVVQIPTTLLAQVDAAIGGKTGVNLVEGKNLVGAFHQPKLVVIDPDVLSTLSDREFRAGLFEVIKCGVIRDAKLFDFMEHERERILQRDPATLLRIITSAVKVKADVVAQDEREGDLRRILNFGHTIGHALEADTGYKHFLHGEAVAWGMLVAVEIGASEGATPRKVADRISRVIESYGPLAPVSSESPDILRLIKSDKKSKNGVPHFVLATRIGSVKIVNDVKPASVKSAVAKLRSATL